MKITKTALLAGLVVAGLALPAGMRGRADMGMMRNCPMHDETDEPGDSPDAPSDTAQSGGRGS